MNRDWRLYFLSKPWLDRWCLWGLRRMLVSGRAWAAAGIAEGDLDRFLAELNLAAPPHGFWKDLLPRHLSRTHELAREQAQATRKWHEAAFAGIGNLAEAEQARRQSAHRYWVQRWVYKKFARQAEVPAVKMTPAPDASLDRIDQKSLFSMPELTGEVRRSLALEHGDGIREYWLAFDHEGEEIIAHVYESAHADPKMPSLVYGHGLAMETEMLMIPDRLYRAWALSGVRVILPDAPGHNRRVAPGFYGGESFLNQPPYSSLSHFSRVSRELAKLIAWAHGIGNGKVALGGISLGALSAQITAQYASQWPKEYQPDALMMAATTAHISRLGKDSAIARVAGIHRMVADWKREDEDKLRRLVDASAAPPIDPDNIVALLGKYDDVTPFQGGLQLAENWRIPRKNLYIRNQGHFSAAFGLQYDWAPVRRLLDILSL